MDNLCKQERRVENLLSEAGKDALRRVLSPSTLYCFDFDGTLAPIVDDPAQARMSEEASRLLRNLAEMVKVAVISGRSVQDLRTRIPFKVDYLIGNHGMEGLPGTWPAPRIRETVLACKRYLEDLILKKGVNGAWVEDKGLSLSLHYRKVAEPESFLSAVLSGIQGVSRTLRLIPGKMVANFVPARAMNKGLALARLMDHAGARRALFVGDDVTDEDVFALKDPRVLSVRIGGSAETAASFRLETQSEVTELLRRILTLHPRRVLNFSP